MKRTLPPNPLFAPWKMLLLMLVGIVTLQLIGITQPYTDTWSWRQGDVAMIAENFFKSGFHLFYPEVNWGGPPKGDVRGYVGTELPIMPWTAALLYQVTGEHEWVGRGLSVLTWALSLPALFLYLRRLINERTALFACLLYCLMPLGIYTARSFMPDMPSLAAAFWALALFDYWLDKRGNWWLVLGTTAAIALAILVKPPSIMIGFPMLVRALQKCGPRIFRDARLWLIAIVSIIPAYFWFKHAAWLGKTYFPHHLFGEEGLRLEPVAFYAERLFDMVFHGMTPVVTGAALVGMIVAWRDRRLWPLYAWFCGWAVFFVIAGHGNRHPWYQLPLAPVLAAFGGVLLVWLHVRISAAKPVLGHIAVFSIVAAVAVTAVPGLALYANSASAPARRAGMAIDRLLPKDATLLVANEGDPILFYYAHRFGWHFNHGKEKGLYQDQPAPGHEEDFAAALRDGRAEGAQYFVLSSQNFWWIQPDPRTGKAPYQALAEELAHYRLVAKSDDYKLYDLRTPISSD